MRAVLIAATLAASLSTGWAADAVVSEETVDVEIPAAVQTRQIVFDIGGGATLSSKWPSSKIYEPGALPLFALQYLRLPYFGEVVTDKVRVFTLYPSFNYVQERESSDASYLAGIPDRDFALELGPGAAVRIGAFRGWAEMRYALTGHNGFVGDFGVQYATSPIDRLQIAIGPRVGLASDNYMEAYFGVPNSATALSAYDPDGGFKDVGFTLDASYRISEQVRIVGRGGYRHFVGDALDSPITKAGNDQEFSIGLGLTYRFGFNFFPE